MTKMAKEHGIESGAMPPKEGEKEENSKSRKGSKG